MNIKDFLIDNYIWIIVIILITIITIIGFLADKKKGDKKVKTKNQDNQNPNMEQPINNMGPITYQNPIDPTQNQMNNNIGMNFNNNLNNTTIEPINQMNNLEQNQIIGNFNQQQIPVNGTIPTGINIQNNPQPIENVLPNNNQEPMYQPLSEQTPVIAPQPIPNFGNNQTPIENIYNQNQGNNFVNMQQNQEQNIIPTPDYNNVQMQEQQPYENNNIIGQPTFNQPNTTIPQPINVIPTPQPVNPQPIMQNHTTEQQMLQSNFNNQSIPNNPIPQTNPQQPVNQPINFVYGPQGNNQNM